jgi:hypothetical protein
MTKGLSKSRYTAFCQCPKNLWLKMYKPDEATSSWNQKRQKSVVKPSSATANSTPGQW